MIALKGSQLVTETIYASFLNVSRSLNHFDKIGELLILSGKGLMLLLKHELFRYHLNITITLRIDCLIWLLLHRTDALKDVLFVLAPLLFYSIFVNLAIV